MGGARGIREKALALDPALKAALWNLALLFERSQRSSDAESLYSRAGGAASGRPRTPGFAWATFAFNSLIFPGASKHLSPVRSYKNNARKSC